MRDDKPPIILGLDDERHYREYLRSSFRLCDREIDTVPNPDNAFRIIHGHHRSLFVVTMDWNLSGTKSGIDFLHYIDKYLAHRVVVIVLTGVSDDQFVEVEKEALEAGAYIVFKKSDPDAIQRIINYSERARVVRSLRQSNEDALTGISNFGYFVKIGVEELRAAKKRSGKPNSAGKHPEIFSLMCIDLNRFKEDINDDHGHFVGDQCLRHVAEFLANNGRDLDHPARRSGDEYLVWLPGADREEAEMIGRKHQLKLATSPILGKGNKPIFISFSFGTATVRTKDIADDAQVTFSEIMELADQRMYKAKEEIGGGRG